MTDNGEANVRAGAGIGNTMGDFHQYFDIILFAMIAAFLILRLRSVLGRRTGNEQPRDPAFLQRTRPVPDQTRENPARDNVVGLPRTNKNPAPAARVSEPGDPISRGLERIHGADADFEPNSFIAGARAAFDIIVGAFARGDTARLRTLLSDEVFDPFSSVIAERDQAHETHETRVVSLKSADIVEAELDGNTARLSMKFVSDQINVTRAHDGSIVDGHPDQPVEKIDYWTFARDTRSADPNWLLVGTRSS